MKSRSTLEARIAATSIASREPEGHFQAGRGSIPSRHEFLESREFETL